MQTFLPYKSFQKSAETLDYRRLSKQRVEAWQILNTLLGKSEGWKNHPAVKMWRGYEKALCVYGITICTIWIAKGYKDTLRSKFKDVCTREFRYRHIKLPPWIGNRAFHDSHKSNLMRKDKEFYKKKFGSFRDDLPYVWPV